MKVNDLNLLSIYILTSQSCYQFKGSLDKVSLSQIKEKTTVWQGK